MARLSITMISAEYLKAHRAYLVASLTVTSDQSDNKQRKPLPKEGSSTNPWPVPTFEFTVEDAAQLDARLKFKLEIEKSTFFCFKKGSFLGRKTDVVGELDVPISDLLANGRAGNTKPKVLRHKGKTVAFLEFSYKFVEAAPELKEETVTVSQAVAHHQMGNATRPPRHLRWNFLEKLGIAVAVNAITSAFNNFICDGGDVGLEM